MSLIANGDNLEKSYRDVASALVGDPELGGNCSRLSNYTPLGQDDPAAPSKTVMRMAMNVKGSRGSNVDQDNG